MTDKIDVPVSDVTHEIMMRLTQGVAMCQEKLDHEQALLEAFVNETVAREARNISADGVDIREVSYDPDHKKFVVTTSTQAS